MSNLIRFPRFEFLVAHRGFSKRCARCLLKICAGDSYLLHTEGRIHASCLRGRQIKPMPRTVLNQEPPHAA